MSQLTPIDKLDSVLKFICTSDFWVTGNPEKYIYGKYNQRHNGIIAEPEFMKILDKLVKDGYLDKSIGHEKAYEYTLTFDGMVFNQAGGYKRESEINAKTESQKDFRELMLLYGTWAVAIGALALVVWEIYKTFVLEKH